MISSWRRPDKICDTIASLVNTCSDVSRMEIVIRFHQNDPISIRMIPEYLAMAPEGTFKILVGSEYEGYKSLSAYYEEIADLCVGTHLWIMNDDVIIEGHGWDTQIHDGDFVFIPESHYLNASLYTKDPSCAWMIYPNKVWTRLGFDHLQNPLDTWMYNVLKDLNFTNVFMPGITAKHSRLTGKELKSNYDMTTEEYVRRYNAGEHQKNKQ